MECGLREEEYKGEDKKRCAEIIQVEKRRPARLQVIQWTTYRQPASIQHMGVDHGGADIGVAQQFLHGADVGAGLQQMRGQTNAVACAPRRVWQCLRLPPPS